MAKSGTGRDVFIYDAVRTPRGKGRSNGALHTVKPISLLVSLMDAIRERNAGLDANLIDDVIIGCTAPLNEQGADIARVAALAAGLPETVAGVQLNRFCASGLEAVNTAAQKIASGWETAILAGGVESMSRQAMGSDGGAWVNDPETSMKTGFVPQGIGADLIATLEGFSRSDVDEWAVTSQERAQKAQQNGYFERSIVPVVDRAGTVVLDRDEYPRAGTTLESLGTLKPSFASLGFDEVALGKYHWLERINHVHHAGNSSGIVDGASLVLLGSAEFGQATGLKPRARVLSTAIVGSEPTIMLTGPTPASRKALAAAGLAVKDVALFEINEAFASVVLKFIKDLELPVDRVNVNGGAIALGHPLGATGGMLVGTVLDELERRDEQVGLITLCVGAGMGITTIIERV